MFGILARFSYPFARLVHSPVLLALLPPARWVPSAAGPPPPRLFRATLAARRSAPPPRSLRRLPLSCPSAWPC
eukprot:9483545-Pyramimonas_sp.AAC.1